ncbi:MAG: hypothetical protein ACI4O7_04510 [Aristaeellaceae bacterium]
MQQADEQPGEVKAHGMACACLEKDAEVKTKLMPHMILEQAVEEILRRSGTIFR